MNLQQRANLAVQALQKGAWAEAINHAKTALAISPQHPELLHILAMSLRGAGYFPQAEQAFKYCLQIEPGHVVAAGNYANLLFQQERYAEAEALYRLAIKPEKANVDANRNLANLLGLKLGRFDEAIHLLEDDASASAQRILADIKHKKGETQDALKIIETLLTEYGPQVDLLLRLGHFMRDLGLSEQAIAKLHPHVETMANRADYYHLMGCLNYDIGEWTTAENLLQVAIELSPGMLEAHRALSQLYWEQARDDDFLLSYRRLKQDGKYTPAVRMNEVSTLVQTKQFDHARNLLVEGLKSDGNLADYRHALGAIECRESNLELARGHLQAAAEAMPENNRWQIDLASVLIQLGNYKDAFKKLEHAGNQLPDNQEIWAYKGLCWRLTGDERFHWLYDERLIDYQPLPIPEGFDNSEHFFAALAESLGKLHTASRQPLDQSVAGGTQSMGNLFVQRDPVIQAYRAALQQRISDFLYALPKGDDQHPFYRRLRGDFRFAGAWSVSLLGDGYHTNHVHPEGWLSGPCYVEVPSVCSPEDDSQQGWVILGETSLNLGEREKVLRAICPSVGMSLLFPSYMWHGTRPFKSSQRRVTAPIDVLPI